MGFARGTPTWVPAARGYWQAGGDTRWPGTPGGNVHLSCQTFTSELLAERSTCSVPRGRDYSWANLIAATFQPKDAPPLTCMVNPMPTVV
jgi:hypothetical protein